MASGIVLSGSLRVETPAGTFRIYGSPGATPVTAVCPFVTGRIEFASVRTLVHAARRGTIRQLMKQVRLPTDGPPAHFQVRLWSRTLGTLSTATGRIRLRLTPWKFVTGGR